MLKKFLDDKIVKISILIFALLVSIAFMTVNIMSADEYFSAGKILMGLLRTVNALGWLLLGCAASYIMCRDFIKKDRSK